MMGTCYTTYVFEWDRSSNTIQTKPVVVRCVLEFIISCESFNFFLNQPVGVAKVKTETGLGQGY